MGSKPLSQAVFEDDSEDKADERGEPLNDKDQTDVPALRRAAMDFLARREHSLLELQQKLSRKFPDDDPERLLEVIAQLRADGLQSDERFCENYIRYRKSRGFGYLHIRADLQNRGVDESILGRYLFDDDDWESAIEEVIARKLGDERFEFGSRAHRRILRFLESRGFQVGLIRKHLDKRLVSS